MIELLGWLGLIAAVCYFSFLAAVLVLDELDWLTVPLYVLNLPAFWLGYFPLIGILIVLEKTGIWKDEGPGDCAFLFFCVFGMPIGWAIIIGGTLLGHYLWVGYDIVPTTQGG